MDHVLHLDENCLKYRHAPRNDVLVNDGPHMRRWLHKTVVL